MKNLLRYPKALWLAIFLVAVLVGGTYYVRRVRQETNLQVSTADWIEYESEKLRFRVKHPRELTVYECVHCGPYAQGVYFAPRKIGNAGEAQQLSDYVITVDDSDSSYRTLEEAVRAYQEAPAGITYVVKDTVVSGFPAKALYYDQETTPLAHVILVHNRRTFVFSFGNSLKQKPQETLERIVASFRLSSQ